MSSSMKLLAGALALGLSACALGTAERPPSLMDPSNPDAHEPPMRVLLALHSTSTPARPPAPPPPPAEDAGPPPATGPYVCPMHPDVTAHEPGRCPRCGMKLVLKAPPPPSPGKSP